MLCCKGGFTYGTASFNSMLKIASTGNVKRIPSCFLTRLRMWFVSQDTKKSPAREALFGDRKTETTEKGAFVSVCAHVLLPMRTDWADDAYLSITWTQLACRVAVDWIFSEGTMQLLLLGLLTQNKNSPYGPLLPAEWISCHCGTAERWDIKAPDIHSLFQYLENAEVLLKFTKWKLVFDLWHAKNKVNVECSLQPIL